MAVATGGLRESVQVLERKDRISTTCAWLHITPHPEVALGWGLWGGSRPRTWGGEPWGGLVGCSKPILPLQQHQVILQEGCRLAVRVPHSLLDADGGLPED